MTEEIELHICARDETLRLLILQKIENISRFGEISEESLKEFCEESDLIEEEIECLTNNLILLGFYHGSN